ncbi:hypothetical protein [Rhizobium rhizoryzae]|uniref:F0F1-type ATP synthase assembly protein I n=1 Tax=Rhizobium rhizoryzae TaxID=451876 RepID=A0A7W6PSX7_9HYPH|nr:hypothetical protein [Rhizobium rhizoryzae]MBB4146008.1 F0F1-type ATP synthase assembly protein I [Rhizobium rhizoryzae]
MLNPLDWLNASEGIYKRAGGVGLTLAVISGTLFFGFETEFLDKQPLDGLPYFFTKLVFWGSIGILLVGLVTSLLQIMRHGGKSIQTLLADRAARRTEIRLLRENTNLIDAETCLRLWTFMESPSGRFLSDGYNRATIQLLRAKFIEKESGDTTVYTYPGEHLKVTDAAMDATVRRAVELRVEASFPNATISEERRIYYIRSLPLRYVGHAN